MTLDQYLFLLGLLAVILMGLAGWILYRRRLTPAERERRRRLLVNRIGRMSDATLTNADEKRLYYSYTVMGVNYATSQDVSELQEMLPADHDALIGPVTLKYVPGNPANSILLCEEWSGLRSTRAHLAPVGDQGG